VVVIERKFKTPGSLRLDLAVPAGSIDIETVEGDETYVSVDSDKEKDLEEVKIELRERGDGHEIVVSVERRVSLGGILQISIGSVSIGGGHYRVLVRCPRGADLAVRSASADLDARGSFGSGDVKTVSGDAKLGELEGDLILKTVSGDVDSVRVGGKLVAQTVSGDLRFDDAASTVTAKSVSGDVRVVVASGDVGLTSVSGDIEVAVRRGSRLYVDANSVSGDLDSDVPLVDDPGAGEAAGPLIELRAKTVSGDFRVVRA
jgi:hypothetical protein